MRSLLFLLLLFWGADLCASGRLAVIASPDVPNEESLLLVALSGCAGVELVERTEVEKLLSERKMAAQNPGEVAALLRANGLVFLELAGGFLTARVVDGQSGAILGIFSSPMPVADVENWAKIRAEEIAKLAKKLPLAATGAIPVSLYRINSATRGTAAEALEASLNLLLASRLSSHEGVALLERSKLQDAAAEDSLTSGESDFWKSAWIVEGSVTASTSEYRIHLRLQPPGGREARVLDIQAADLPSAVEKTNAAIVGALGKQGTDWDGAAEAARLVEEAKWAASNRMWDQAIAAVEAAIALGDRGTDLLKWRWRCYQQIAWESDRDKAGSAKSFPSVRRVGAMARSLQACGQWLARPADEKPVRRFPSPGGSVTPFATPAGEATGLLASASQLIRKFSQKNAPEMDLGELRTQIHALFDEIVRLNPDLQFRPREGDDVPALRREGDPRRREWASLSGGGFPGEVKRQMPYAHIERLRSGRLWEDSAGPYHAYIKKCLESDLAADPDFYPLAISIIADLAESESFLSTNNSAVEEWKKLALALAGEKIARLQIGAAAVLCRIGLPMEGLKIFELRRDEVLKEKFPLEYLFVSFSAGPAVQTIITRQGEGSLRDATGSLVKFVVSLWKDGLAPTERVVEALAALPLSDRQLAAVLPALRERSAGGERFSRAVNAMAARAGEKLPPVPEQSSLPGTATAPAVAKEERIEVDLAWVARNADPTSQPGKIRWVIPDANRVWLEVEYSTREASRVRRQFLVVDLPSLQSRIVYRDVLDKGSGGLVRNGPSFAVSGETVYFWDGRGISCASGGQSRSLDGPDLKQPLLWLVGDYLYAADRDGVLVEYDLRTSASNVVASALRRPAVNPLDAEPSLGDVRRIFEDREGKLTISFFPWDYRREKDGQWQKVQIARGSQTLAEIAESLEYTWLDAALRGAPQLSMLLREVEGLTTVEKGLPMLRFAASQGGVLWCLQSLLGKNTLQLARVELAGGKLMRRTLDFSPEHLAFYGPLDSGTVPTTGFRLIPFESGIVIYAPETPVLWFLPASKIPTLP